MKMFKGSDIPRPTSFDSAWRERDNWIETAAQHAVNEEYWRRRCARAELENNALIRVLAETCLEKADLEDDLARVRSARWN